jgi:hypothetical protein
MLKHKNSYVSNRCPGCDYTLTQAESMSITYVTVSNWLSFLSKLKVEATC